MIKDYPKINQKEYDNLRAFAFRTAKNTLEYYNASDYSWISDEDIDDIVSDAVIKAFETFDVTKGCSLRTWTNLIVRQKAINFLLSRHETSGITYLTEDDDELEIPELADNVTAEDEVISWETSNRIDDILNTLKQDDRTVFTMDRDGYTPAETAEYLNISTQNTYTKLCRIKQKISKSLAA
ncbi:MAG: RNA polymerase sigma factor [Bacteroides sp.]|nr:RNA polymerase sigma factor [Bacteroides sp.]